MTVSASSHVGLLPGAPGCFARRCAWLCLRPHKQHADNRSRTFAVPAILITLIALCPVQAEKPYERFVDEWTTSCTLDGRNFQIASKDPSWDLDLDYDGESHFLFISPSDTSLDDLAGLNLRASAVSDVPSICEDLPVFDIGHGDILIWLLQDMRPGFDALTVVRYNTTERKVRSKIDQIGEVKSLRIRKANGGFDVTLVMAWLKNTGSDSAENAIEDWMRISTEDNTLTKEWMDENLIVLD